MREPREPLPVCPHCGWHVLMHHDCEPELGAAAQRLIAAAKAAGIDGTQLGYGGERVTLEIGDNCSLTFRVEQDGFDIEHVHCLRTLSEQDCVRLVVAFAAAVAVGASASVGGGKGGR